MIETEYCKATLVDNPDALAPLPPSVREFVSHKIDWMKPTSVYICNGSESEAQDIIMECQRIGMVKPLKKYENCWLSLTDPSDVARVESKTFIVTENEREATTIPNDGTKSQLGNWWSPAKFEEAAEERFPGCMKGRTMYVVPFSMGPLGSPLSKIGIQLTDSPYVVASMRIMTRMGAEAMQEIVKGRPFIECVHSVGQPEPMKEPPVNNWPCNPAKTIIAHIPDKHAIMSFGSGYGGNSLLGKKCLALRLGSILAHKEGWFAEHMLILGMTNPQGHKKYIAAAFPSQCGKTNLAMLEPSCPGYKIQCVGDDIAWMKFDANGQLRAINPEHGFFGVAPGTTHKTNPNAMESFKKNTIFTNVAETSDGGFFWEGLEDELDLEGVSITDWRGKPYTLHHNPTPAAHPNSRFCSPASQCPIIDPLWEEPEGVVIDAILFGGRRPEGVPLIYEATSWRHGVLMGTMMRSECTAAAEHKGKQIMHDPFAMRPFFGYNFGQYIAHWLSFGDREAELHLPKIFHVNWFRKNADGKFLWPGFGENIRVLDWVFRRVDGHDDIMKLTPIGYVPTEGSINLEGTDYKHLDMKELFSLPKDFWLQEMDEIKEFLEHQVAEDAPPAIMQEIARIRAVVDKEL